MSSSSKAGSSSEIDAEIARLMRDPDALRSERGGMQRPGGHGHYDPNQPRVPAGDPRGGQFASKGYRGGDSGGDAGMTRAAQFAQLGPGAAHAQPLPFNGELGFMSPAQNRIETAGPPSSKRTRTPREIGATISKATMDGSDSYLRDQLRANQSPAGPDGLSRQ